MTYLEDTPNQRAPITNSLQINIKFEVNPPACTPPTAIYLELQRVLSSRKRIRSTTQSSSVNCVKHEGMCRAPELEDERVASCYTCPINGNTSNTNSVRYLKLFCEWRNRSSKKSAKSYWVTDEFRIRLANFPTIRIVTSAPAVAPLG